MLQTYTVICDRSNNTDADTAAGRVVVDITISEVRARTTTPSIVEVEEAAYESL